MPEGVTPDQAEAAEPEFQVGTILGFRGSWGSGLACLLIQGEDGETVPVMCDNAPTVRALSNFIPDVIGPGHTVNQEALQGVRVRYGTDGMLGLLEWIGPAEVS